MKQNRIYTQKHRNIRRIRSVGKKLTICRNNLGLIGGGAYWAGRATARPLFSPCGQSLFFARPLFVVENLYFVVIQQRRGL